jgi:hypothetical protein
MSTVTTPPPPLAEATRWRSMRASLARQARQIAVALALALAVAPAAAAMRLMTAAALTALSDGPSSACHGLNSDDNGVIFVVVGGIASLVGSLGFVISSLQVSRKGLDLLPHVLVGGFIGCALMAALYVGPITSGRTIAPDDPLPVFFGLITDLVTRLAPYVSLVAWRLLANHCRNSQRVLRTLIDGIVLSLASLAIGTAITFYVVLSNQTSGWVGFAINGT